jgi:hypothetical protein
MFGSDFEPCAVSLSPVIIVFFGVLHSMYYSVILWRDPRQGEFCVNLMNGHEQSRMAFFMYNATFAT